MKSPVTLFVVFCLFLFLLKTAWSMYQKSELSETRVNDAQLALDQISVHKQDLADKVSYLSTDQGIQSEIRSKFHAAADGESVAVIIGDQQTAAVVKAPDKVTVSWWQRVLHMFGI